MVNNHTGEDWPVLRVGIVGWGGWVRRMHARTRGCASTIPRRR